MALSSVRSAAPSSLGADTSTSLANGIGADSVACRLTSEEGDFEAFRDDASMKDLDFNCSGLLGSRSFPFLFV